MSRIDKLKRRLASRPRDFTFDEVRRLLCAIGYREMKSGKTAGSRAAFLNPESGHIIRLHRPHPSPILKSYQVDQLVDELLEKGLIPR